MNVAMMLERMGRDEDAIKFYQAAYRIDPNSAVASRRLITIYQRTGRLSPTATPTAAESSDLAVAHK